MNTPQIAAQLSAQSEDGNATIPIGEWAAQALFWANDNLDWLTSKIVWPFTKAHDLLVDGRFETLSPWWLVALVLFVCLAKRQVPEAAKATVAMALTIGLGDVVARAAAETFSSVLISLVGAAVVAIPLGLFASRSALIRESGWVLERLGLIHPWLLSLPMVFLFGIGGASSMMLAALYAGPVMFFAVTTNHDSGTLKLALHAVQRAVLPALWLHAFAAIMGAGGVGMLTFRALNNLSAADAFNAGFALTFVGYALQMVFTPTDSNDQKVPITSSGIDDNDEALTGVPLTPIA